MTEVDSRRWPPSTDLRECWLWWQHHAHRSSDLCPQIRRQRSQSRPWTAAERVSDSGTPAEWRALETARSCHSYATTNCYRTLKISVPVKHMSLIRFTRTTKRLLWPTVTSGLCVGPNWYGLSTGQLIPVHPEGKLRNQYNDSYLILTDSTVAQ